MSPKGASPDREFSFGPYRLIPARRLLLNDGQPVRIGSRALDVLEELVEHAGEVVSKEQLIARAWPGTFVEENNLRGQILQLRKLLGDGIGPNRFVLNVAGRGYEFIAPVLVSTSSAPVLRDDDTPERNEIPTPITRMVGRDETVASVASLLLRRRFVTLAGPGGIGKTTVALAVAHKTRGTYADGAKFVNFSTVSDPGLVAETLALALGSGSSREALMEFLARKEMLLVLDNCEHVVERVAALAEDIVRSAPKVNLLATSREPLRATGESVKRLSPLAVPPASPELSATEALSYAAVELFVERASAVLDTFLLTDASARTVADICRKLDGIALAIELAASRMDAFSVSELAIHLEDRVNFLSKGNRTAMPRHQTLSAMLDWSYALLPANEQTIFRRLGTIAGSFGLETALAVVAGDGIVERDVVPGIENLVSKSLVVADIGEEVAQYRLLQTTRAYALKKLDAAGELAANARRHALYYSNVFETMRAERETAPTPDWLATYAPQLDDLRVALDWAFSSVEHPEMAVAMTVSAIPLWMHLSLTNECRRRVEQALAIPNDLRTDRQNMQLYAALGGALNETAGAGAETVAVLTRALDLADRLADVEHQLRVLWQLWACKFETGEFRDALSMAEKFATAALSSSEPADSQVADRMIGGALLVLGDLEGAARHTRRLVEQITPPRRSDVARFTINQKAQALSQYGGILYHQGYLDQSAAMVQSAISNVLRTAHSTSICNVLVHPACQLALLTEDLEHAREYNALLTEHTFKSGRGVWQVWCRCYTQILRLREADDPGALEALGTAFAELSRWPAHPRNKVLICEYALALGRAGRATEAVTPINETLLRSERAEEWVMYAELLRVKAELVALGLGSRHAARDLLHEAITFSGAKGMISLQLRAAFSLARLDRDGSQGTAARDVLASVYDKFTEGFATPVLVAAQALLER
jgi:predicted ATPase/DNA-binding winged helix-turn-helix (wHTH) protein